MGLREKAVQFRDECKPDIIDNLEKCYEGRVLSGEELLELKKEFQRKLFNVTSLLDRKLLDMKTLFEIGKEINSTLNFSDLIQILIFTFMGHFRIAETAVFLIKNGQFELQEYKGSKKVESFTADSGLLDFLNKRNSIVSTQELNQQGLSGFSIVSPIKNKDNLIGIITLGNKPENEPFSDEDRNFIYTLSSLAGIAIENARLFQELKDAYEKLDKKVNELSALYEISKVIYGSDNYSLVLSLIVETLATGFGVKKAVLFTFEEGTAVIKKEIGVSQNICKNTITLTPDEEKLLDENKTGVLSSGSRFSKEGIHNTPCLFVPLISTSMKIGGILIYEFNNYNIDNNNTDLLTLFSIIASQAAPPILMTKMILESKEKIQDPYTPMITRINKEIEQAKDFGANIGFLMLKISNFSEYIRVYGGTVSSGKFINLMNEIAKYLPESIIPIRYSSNKILFIIPGFIESEVGDTKDAILSTAKTIFRDSSQVIIKAEIKAVVYPDESQDPLELLNSIE